MTLKLDHRRSVELKVADEVWIATALLHETSPTQPDFSVEDIVARAQKENLAGALRPSVYVHVLQHCVANRPPNPGRYRMLYETAPGRRRLYRLSDSYDPRREGSKTLPIENEIPKEYRYLLGWYHEWSGGGRPASLDADALLTAARLGREIWKDVDPDDYVRQLREGWE
jgi:hypothetical protein